MAVLLDKNTRLLVQGLTGREGTFHAKAAAAYHTAVVGGVTPGKGGSTHEGWPIFNTVADAVKQTGANASVIFVPPPFAADAIMEATDAGIGLVVCITEGIPVVDMLGVMTYLKEHPATRLIGPNCPGLISPGKGKAGIIPANICREGRIGIVSKSGTLTYEALDDLQAQGFGESSIVCLGGDPVLGTTYADVLPLFEADPETDLVLLIGEPGGRLEYEAIEVIAGMRKPVVAYIAAQNAPPEKRMGHAGAIYDRGDTTATAKLAAFRAAGCEAFGRVTEIAAAVERTLRRRAA
jgi:succinyl-CoA synthetase alpha subunit